MSTSGSFVPAVVPECPYAPRMTRAAALALRAAGGLRENCVVVLHTDTPTIGTAGNTSPTEIELNPVGPSEFGLAARVHTTFDNTSWNGLYDIDLGTAGSITRLTDASNNTVEDKDADSPTVHGQFPWHLPPVTPGLRDNLISDVTLTNWATLAVGDVVQDNTIRGGTLDLGAAGGTVTVQQCEILANAQVIQRTGVCNLAWSRSKISACTMTLNGASGTFTMTDCSVRATTANRAAAATAAWSWTNSDIDATTVNANNTGGIAIANSSVRGSTLTNAVTATRGITLSGSTVWGSTVNQNRTLAGSTNSDFLLACTVQGSSVVNFDGAAGSAGNGQIDRATLEGTSTLTVTDISAAAVVRDLKVAGNSTVNITSAPTGIVFSDVRVDMRMTINTPGNLAHAQSIFELPNATKTLTAANLGRLCNKSFDDVL